MKKHILIAFFICCLGVTITACSNDNSVPDYLLEGARDNGFIASYRAYYAVKDNDIKKITRSKYEKYIYNHNKDTKYEYLAVKSYSFDAWAKTFNPGGWDYKQSKYDHTEYDIETLINYLTIMDTGYISMPSPIYEDSVYILITEFDDYAIIEADLLRDGHTELESKYALFHDGEMISNSLDLSSIQNIYKYQQ